MTDHVIDLRRPTEAEAKAKDDRFDRGERIIVVDGVRWGRTIVGHHGMHGTKHVFKQDRAGIIEAKQPGSKYVTEVAVRSKNKRKAFYRNEEFPKRFAVKPIEPPAIAKPRQLSLFSDRRGPRQLSLFEEQPA
jgi:hypothetical protein